MRRTITNGRLTKKEREIQRQKEIEQELDYVYRFDTRDELNEPDLANLLLDIKDLLDADSADLLLDQFHGVTWYTPSAKPVAAARAKTKQLEFADIVPSVTEGHYIKDGIKYRAQRSRSGDRLYALRLAENDIYEYAKGAIYRLNQADRICA